MEIHPSRWENPIPKGFSRRENYPGWDCRTFSFMVFYSLKGNRLHSGEGKENESYCSCFGELKPKLAKSQVSVQNSFPWDNVVSVGVGMVVPDGLQSYLI